jgi:hypothetical protein
MATGWSPLPTRISIVPEKFMDFLGKVSVENARKEWMRLSIEVHHGVPRVVQEALGIPSSKWDETPAFMTTMEKHRVGLQSLHGRMIANDLPMNKEALQSLGKVRILERLEKSYSDAGLGDFWSECEQFLNNSLP